MPDPAMLIAAASGRALAASARRAGYRPLVVDYFADQDTIANAQAYVRLASGLDRGMQAPEVMAALQTLSEQHETSGVVWGSGFEDRPSLLRHIAQTWNLIGNGPDVVDHVKHPMLLAKLCHSCGIPYPETRLDPPDDRDGWLTKRVGGAGGTHIRGAAFLPPPGGGRSTAEGGRVGVTALEHQQTDVLFTPPRRAARADPPPPGEGEAQCGLARTRPTMSFTGPMVSAASARARSAPLLSTESI